LVPREQTLYLAQSIQGAPLGLFPLGSHVFHQEQPKRVTLYIREVSASTV
jgi:pimeloyl-ACP methyl ester carboxylesterase